jgi:hypothetical protein
MPAWEQTPDGIRAAELRDRLDPDLLAELRAWHDEHGCRSRDCWWGCCIDDLLGDS